MTAFSKNSDVVLIHREGETLLTNPVHEEELRKVPVPDIVDARAAIINGRLHMVLESSHQDGLNGRATCGPVLPLPLNVGDHNVSDQSEAWCHRHPKEPQVLVQTHHRTIEESGAGQVPRKGRAGIVIKILAWWRQIRRRRGYGCVRRSNLGKNTQIRHICVNKTHFGQPELSKPSFTII